MKLQIQREIDLDVELEIESVAIHFDLEGLHIMLDMEGSPENYNDDENNHYVMTWNETFKWMQASSHAEGNAETIIEKLRELADKMEKWNNQ